MRQSTTIKVKNTKSTNSNRKSNGNGKARPQQQQPQQQQTRQIFFSEDKTEADDSAKSARKQVLQNRVIEILDDFEQIKKEEDKLLENFSEKVRFMAVTLEETYLLSDLTSEIDGICGEIIRMLHGRQIFSKDRLVRWALPQKFHRAKDLPEEDEEEQKEAAIRSSLEASASGYITAATIQVNQSQNIFDLTKPEVLEQLKEQGNLREIRRRRDLLRNMTENLGQSVQDLTSTRRVATDTLDIAKARCEVLGIAVDPDKVRPDKTPISAKPLLTGYSLLQAKARELGELWIRISEKIYKYKPLTEEQAQQLGEVLELQIEMDKPFADEKYRLEIIQWTLAMANEAMEGKHAAAERYHYILPKQTKEDLERQGEDVVKLALDPSSGLPRIEVEKVSIVREEIGDVKEPMFRLMGNVLLSMFPKYVALLPWFVTHTGWSAGKRKQEAHTVLSAAA